jgi:penicillin-binding protein 1C
VLLYPPDVTAWMAQSGQSVPVAYRHNPGCSEKSSIGSVAIVYPPNASLLSVPVDFGSVKQKITLRAAATDIKSLLYWYLDGAYLGTTEGVHELALSLIPGDHSLSVTDESGLTAVSKFSVK